MTRKRCPESARMTVGPGSRIGPYEVTALIGEGGMGRVWRAHHTGLKREDASRCSPKRSLLTRNV